MSFEIEKKAKNPWDEILLPENEEVEIKREAQFLMFTFLSEIERFQEIEGINRKKLAEKIKATPSYLTQLFRGNKPLNFVSIAKIKKALNIRFEVKAYFNEVISDSPSYSIPTKVIPLNTHKEFVEIKETGEGFSIHPQIKMLK